MCQIVTNSLKQAYFRVGASATPYRDSGDDMLIRGCFGKNLCEISASELIQSGHLVKPTIYFIHVKGPKSRFQNWQNIYDDCIVENERYNCMIASLAEEYIKKGRRVLVLVQRIPHGKMLEQMVPGSTFLSGQSSKKKRLQMVARLTEGHIRCIISTAIFDEGIDIRPLDTLILAGQGKSPTRALQRIGRVIRTFKNKTTATVVDFMVYQKYLHEHGQARLKIYRTEPEFVIEPVFISGD